MLVLILTIIVFVLCFSGIAIKIILKENGKFSGTCASMSPALREKGGSCGLCGRKVDEIEENENCDEILKK